MAHTVDYWYQFLVTEKNNQVQLQQLQPNIDNEQTLLSDLTTASKVAIWRLIFYVVAFAMWTLEMLWDLFKVEVEEIAANAIPGTVRWYQSQALLFQYGDTLLYINNKFQYAIIDATKQIIKRAAVIEVGSQVRIKVATLDVSNNVIPLNGVQLAAFDAYIVQIKFAGTNTAVISRVPDLLKLFYKVYYDPLVLKATGESIAFPGTFPVEDAINNYISNLPFNGDLELNALNDAIQAAAGDARPYLISADAKYGLLPYTPIVEKYNPDAGHLIIDPAFPLVNTLTYVPNV